MPPDAAARERPPSLGARWGPAPTPEGLLLEPFRALRPSAAWGAALAERLAPPHDSVVGAGLDVERLAPLSAARLLLPDAGTTITDATGTDATAADFGSAAGTLRDWVTRGLLRRDPVPALYVLEQTTAAGRVQRGLLGALALSEPADAIVLPHEATTAGPVAARLAVLRATATDVEPVTVLYDDQRGPAGAASALLQAVARRPPGAETVTADGDRHRLWVVSDPLVLAAVRADLLPREAVLADGHHRWAALLQERSQRYGRGAGRGPWDSALALLVATSEAAGGLRPFHRVVPGLPPWRALALAATAFRTEQLAGRGSGESAADWAAGLLARLRTAGPGIAFVLSGGSTATLLTHPDPLVLAKQPPAGQGAAWWGLDVAVAHQLLVQTLWGLPDDVEVVRTAGEASVALQTATRTKGTALLLNPPTVQAVLAVARAGELMPRTSTLFTPKPRAGLVLRPRAGG